MSRIFHASASKWLACLPLAAVTFLAYLPALSGGFVWDDDQWTVNLARWLQNAAGLVALWAHPTILPQYYPLTASSFWVDYQFWHFWTLPYHVENVLLHLLSVLLLWRLLRRLQIPGAWLAAALFALHPVMVQSVAWITERKNALSLVLYLSAFLAYMHYQEESKIQGSRFKVFYGLALALFVGALLAKTTAFSLPAVILLLAWWRRGRLEWRADVLPTLPFFALSVGMCAMTAWVEKTHVGAHGPEFDLSLAQRCLVAGRVFWFYLGKLLWPAHLCFVYPRWQPDPGVWWQWLYPAAAAGLLLGLWLARNRIGRGPVAAAFFYVGTLLPLLGFVSAYAMRYSFVWNHWVYLPSLGPLVLVAALLELARQRASTLHLPSSLFCLLPLVLGVLTWHEAGQYADLETLWRSTLARNPDCWMAQTDLAKLLCDEGKPVEAEQLCRTALQLKPDHVEALCNLGNALAMEGRMSEAENCELTALRLDTNCAIAEVDLGFTLAQQGKWIEAISHYERALQIDPDFTRARVNIGVALVAQRKLADAIPVLEVAVQRNPYSGEAQYNLGFVLTMQGRWTDALPHLERAVEQEPDYPQAHLILGVALSHNGQAGEAVSEVGQALSLAMAQGNTAVAERARAMLMLRY